MKILQTKGIHVIVVALIFILYITSSYRITLTGDLYGEFLDLYIEIAKLATQGVDVSNLIEKLKKVHENLINHRDEDAILIIEDIRNEINTLKQSMPTIIFFQNLVKGLMITFLASIPILIYILLPRIYIYLWYRARRKWVVKLEST